MHTIPNVTCSKVLDTVRLSGLTYSLTETPYSAYLSIRKKFIKGFSPTTPTITSLSTSSGTFSPSPSTTSSAGLSKISSDTSASDQVKADLNHTKAELSKLKKSYEKLASETRIEHSKLTSAVNKLTEELATEIDDHARSEHALRSLEEKNETVMNELDKQANENKALRKNISDYEDTVAHYQTFSQSLNHSLAQTQEKLTEAHNTEAGILRSKILELEGTVSGKNRIISLLKDQAVISSTEISDLKSRPNALQLSQTLHSTPTQTSTSCNPSLSNTNASQSDAHSSQPDTHTPQPNFFGLSTLHQLCDLNKHTVSPPSHVPQPSTSTGIVDDPKVTTDPVNDEHNSDTSHGTLNTLGNQIIPGDTLTDDLVHKEINDTDINDNLAPNTTEYFHPLPQSSDDEAWDALDPDSHSNTSHTTSIDPLTHCKNCLNKPENDDIDMDLPPPIYELNFIRECPSPWLHHGYCTACLDDARRESSDRGERSVIIEHIAICPGLLNQCFTGEHEAHIKMITEREKEIIINTYDMP